MVETKGNLLKVFPQLARQQTQLWNLHQKHFLSPTTDRTLTQIEIWIWKAYFFWGWLKKYIVDGKTGCEWIEMQIVMDCGSPTTGWICTGIWQTIIISSQWHFRMDLEDFLIHHRQWLDCVAKLTEKAISGQNILGKRRIQERRIKYGQDQIGAAFSKTTPDFGCILPFNSLLKASF